MTLAQLHHLLALADVRSFSKAAERVHLTQPALSRSIRSLEDDLGHRIVDRIGHKIEFTPMGRDVLERARQLVADAQDLRLRSRSLAEGQGSLLRIGMGSGPGAMLMTPLLRDAAARRPPWRVEVARSATALLVQRLRARELDALVVDLRSLEVSVDLEVDQVHEMRGAFMVRRSHPLARKRAVGFDALRDYPIASIPLSAEVARLLVQRYGPQAHPDQAVSLRCDDIASLVDVAQHTDAVLLTIRATAPDLAELRMQPALDVSARLGLVTLARRTLPGSLALLRELMNARLTS